MQRIEAHLRNISKIYRQTASDFTEIFCPFCNDSTRKANPNHGHLYFSISINYFRCFRCNEVGSLTRLLQHTGFSDNQVLSALKSKSRDDISYARKVKQRQATSFEPIDIKRKRALEKYSIVRDTEEFSIFYNYMINRCLDINFSNYFVYPEKKFNKLTCSFYNYDNRFVTSRFINPTNNMRYHNAKDKVLYYFQDINKMVDYDEIVICEGIFDLINIHNYCTMFGNGNVFYIAMNGSSYVQTIKMIVVNYLLLGSYTIHVVVDRGLIGVNGMIRKSQYQTQRWNNKISLNFYEPTMSKDVSELMMLERMNI